MSSGKKLKLSIPSYNYVMLKMCPKLPILTNEFWAVKRKMHYLHQALGYALGDTFHELIGAQWWVALLWRENTVQLDKGFTIIWWNWVKCYLQVKWVKEASIGINSQFFWFHRRGNFYVQDICELLRSINFILLQYEVKLKPVE